MPAESRQDRKSQAPTQVSRFGYVGPREAVRDSEDLQRILRLPRRPPSDLTKGTARAEALVELMTGRLRRADRPPGAPCGCAALGRVKKDGTPNCVNRLLPAQAWALFEAPLAGGLFASVGVGSGKTLLDVLVAMVMPDCRVAALLVPPGLVGQLGREYLAIREHFNVPSLILPGAKGWVVPGGKVPAVHVVPYSRFSHTSSTDLLERLKPDLIIADEVHKLKNKTAARTGRFLRRFADAPDTRLCCWSGTVTSRSIKDFAHLIAFALGEGSPLPLLPETVDEWAGALDPSDWPAPAGAIRLLGRPNEEPIEAVRRRIAETRGVITTVANEGGVASIVLRERKAPPMPNDIADAIVQLHKTWCRPDGEELLLALDVARCARELACGFFYRWRFPGKPTPEAVEAWFAARKAWGKEMREKLKRPEPHLDSPKLLANAAERALAGYTGDLPVWHSDTWERWRDLRHTVKHVTEAVWISDYLVEDTVAWAKDAGGIVWYEQDAFGERVAKLGGFPKYGGGDDAAAEIAKENGSRPIVVSRRAHGEGRDGLQHGYSRQLVANPPADGLEWEQLLGRLDRRGQAEDEVVTEVYRHTVELRDAIDKALRFAKYIEGITSASQKLLRADVEWEL